MWRPLLLAAVLLRPSGARGRARRSSPRSRMFGQGWQPLDSDRASALRRPRTGARGAPRERHRSLSVPDPEGGDQRVDDRRCRAGSGCERGVYDDGRRAVERADCDPGRGARRGPRRRAGEERHADAAVAALRAPLPRHDDGLRRGPREPAPARPRAPCPRSSAGARWTAARTVPPSRSRCSRPAARRLPACRSRAAHASAVPGRRGRLRRAAVAAGTSCQVWVALPPVGQRHAPRRGWS